VDSPDCSNIKGPEKKYHFYMIFFSNICLH
jgi:hypothetical protein